MKVVVVKANGAQVLIYMEGHPHQMYIQVRPMGWHLAQFLAYRQGPLEGDDLLIQKKILLVVHHHLKIIDAPVIIFQMAITDIFRR